jgi:acyl-CoA dehydrogenase
MILGVSALRRFEAEGRRKEDLPMLHYALTHALHQVQEAYVGIYRNFGGVVGWFLRVFGGFWLRSNPLAHAPTDGQSRRAALCIQSNNEQFQRLAYAVFLPIDDSRALGRLLKAFALVSAAHPAAEKIIRAQKARKLPRGYLPADIADEAVKNGIITAADAEMLKQALKSRLEAIEVDEFKPEQYFATVTPEGGLHYGERAAA